METNEELDKVKNIIRIIPKARKISRLYPQNNPVCMKTMQEVYDRFDDFFGNADTLRLQFGKNSIFYNSESVYHNPERMDNLALLFFKDGVRELTFKKGMTHAELGDFLRIISRDFDMDMEDDLVTILWEKNFENISYVVEDSFLAEGEELEEKAVREVRQKAPGSEEEPLKTFEDNAGNGGAIKDLTIFSLTDDDFRSFFSELEKEAHDKTGKLFNILFELFLAAEGPGECSEIANHFMRAVEFSVTGGNLGTVVEAQANMEQMLQSDIHEEAKKHLSKVMLYAGGHSILTIVGEMLDKGGQIDEPTFRNFAGHLKTNAILPLMKILAELKSISARRMVVDALVHIGKKDVSLLFQELNDPRWYVVRNIVHILRKIGDKKAVKPLLKLLPHKDIRVRKEVIRTLGEIGGDSVLEDLRGGLEDTQPQIRKTVLAALGQIRSESARELLIGHITGRTFNGKDFNEKKECFQTLSLWRDDSVYDFLVRILKRRSFFSAKKAENRACAAYCLGLLEKRDALELLNRYKTCGNKLLREFSLNAIRKLEYGS
ncbi:MAG: HEAT repeat domain-containing protein [Nitrospiraceae bacterium]|nr:MAG: HEAT repeat domain-containing protein [Nitrospiraceae bacterium]